MNIFVILSQILLDWTKNIMPAEAENEPLDPFGINYTTNIASFLNLKEGAVFRRVSTTTLETFKHSISRLNFELRKHSPFFRDLLKVEASTSSNFNYEETTRNNLVSADTSFQQMMCILMDSSHPAPLKPLTDAKAIIGRVEQLRDHYIEEILNTINYNRHKDDLTVSQLPMLLKQGCISAVLPIIKLITAPYSKPRTHVELAEALLITAPYSRPRTHVELAEALLALKKIDEARKIIATMYDPDRKATQVELVKALLALENINEARNVITTINDPRFKALAQVELVKALLIQEKVNEALNIIVTIDVPYGKALAYIEFVKVRPNKEIMYQVRTIIATIRSSYDRAIAQVELVKAQPTSENIAEARSTIQTIEYSYDKIDALCELIKAQPTQDNIDMGLNLIAETRIFSEKVNVQFKFVRVLTQEYISVVRNIVATIHSPYYKALGQIELVKLQPTRENIREAYWLIENIDAPADVTHKAEAQLKLVKALVLHGNLKEARQLIADIQDIALKAKAQIACFDTLFVNPSSVKFTSPTRSETRIGHTSLSHFDTSNTVSKAHSQSELSYLALL